MEIRLVAGRMETLPNMDGWVVTTNKATLRGREDDPWSELRKGDKILVDGRVVRRGQTIFRV